MKIPSERDTALMQTAHAIAERLLANAVWHGDECTWVGPVGVGVGNHWNIQHQTLGGSLYDGTAGIALYLGEVAAIVDDSGLASCAEAALHYASRVATGSGLYTGLLGVGLAALRLGDVLDSHKLRDLAATNLRRVDDLPIDGFDLLSGASGSAIGLLCAFSASGNDRWLSTAIDVGKTLIEMGETNGMRASWPRKPGVRGRHLLGLSHGAAGAAMAFSALFEVTGEAEFREFGLRAINYEDTFYNSTLQNWPDLREATGRGRSLLAPYVSLWCHGAPGIGLSRVRGAALWPNTSWGRDLGRATACTKRTVEDGLSTGSQNFSVCHGMAGNAEALLICDAGQIETAAEVAEYGRLRFMDGPEEWPCGVSGGGVSPSLFLGLAGIGRFFARLANPELPSVLNIDPDRWMSPI